MVARPAADEDRPKAELLLRAFGGVLRGVAARIGAMARSGSGCLLAADAGEPSHRLRLAPGAIGCHFQIYTMTSSDASTVMHWGRKKTLGRHSNPLGMKGFFFRADHQPSVSADLPASPPAHVAAPHVAAYLQAHGTPAFGERLLAELDRPDPA